MMLRHLPILAALVAAFAAPHVRGAQEPAAASSADTVQAIWKTQEITFYFQSFTTFYSCDGLESKLRRILKALGAQARVRVRAPECPAVADMPRVILEVTSPVEATPEALAEREKGRSTRELVHRVRGTSAEQAAFMEEFPAYWKEVSLSRGKLNLAPGDCELIDEVRRKILPKLAVRIVDDDMHCTPNQLSLNQPSLQVQVLVEAPKPDDPAPE